MNYVSKKKKRFIFLCLVSLLLPINVFALSLDEAKSKGFLGETPSGYLGVVIDKPTPEIVALQKNINQQRREKYKEIADKNGTALSAVEQLAGRKAIENTASGLFVQTADGLWLKK